MKPKYKKTFWGSVVSLFLGTSCCWMSSVAVWFGGATFVGLITRYLENAQAFLIGVGIILSIITIFHYMKNRKVV